MNKITAAALLLLGCSSTTTNDSLFGQGNDASSDALGGSAGQAGAAGLDAGPDAPGGSAGQAGSPGGGGVAGTPTGGGGSSTGGSGGTGGTTVDPCATCKIYPNGTTTCKGTAADPALWEHCLSECTPVAAGKTCTKTDSFPSCVGAFAGKPCNYWCCK